MSGRLASFKGPSTPLSPDSSPSGKKKSSNNRGSIAGNRGGNLTPPASPGRELESTFHRKIRALLLETRSICRLWSDIVLHDGLKAAKTLVDTRTELECVSASILLNCLPFRMSNRISVECSNALAALPPGESPKYRIAGPKLRIMDKQVRDLDNVLTKLVSEMPSLFDPSSSYPWTRKIYWSVWIRRSIRWSLYSSRLIEPKVGSGSRRNRCGHLGHSTSSVWA